MLRTTLATLMRWLRPRPPARVDVTEVIRLMNLERTARGLDPLNAMALLTASAQDWADVMARLGDTRRGNFPGRMSVRLPAGGAAPAALVRLWMADAGHRANILGPWNVAGSGLARSPSGTPYWCVDFDKSLTTRPR